MAYEMEDIRCSQEIFYYLIQHRELTEESNEQLYRSYIENDTVRSLVKSQANIADSEIEKYGKTIYLIPGEDNKVLGFSKKALKSKMCRSKATDKEYYLSQFIVLTLLVEFYDGQGSSSKSRDFMKLGDLINCITQRLEAGAAYSNEEEEEKNGIAFTNMKEVYESLKSVDTSSRSRENKVGFITRILQFLQEQGLVDYVEADEMIKTTQKLDNFMDWNLLNRNHYDRILRIMGDVDLYEQNQPD